MEKYVDGKKVQGDLILAEQDDPLVLSFKLHDAAEAEKAVEAPARFCEKLGI